MARKKNEILEVIEEKPQKEEKQVKKLELFDFVDMIAKKKYEWNEDVESVYNTFIINKHFSYFPDSVFIANELNQYWELDKKMQFDLYYHMLPKAPRITKWAKKEAEDNEDKYLEELLHYSKEKIKAVKPILESNKNYKKVIKKYMDFGGKR